MTNKDLIQTLPENPDPQEKRLSVGDITHPQEQQVVEKPPKSLVEWLVRTLALAASAGVNQRYLALNQEKTNDTS